MDICIVMRQLKNTCASERFSTVFLVRSAGSTTLLSSRYVLYANAGSGFLLVRLAYLLDRARKLSLLPFKEPTACCRVP